MKIDFTKEEISYIKDLVEMSADSLKDITDEKGIVNVDWLDITQEEVDEERAIINSILEKLEV